MRLKLITGKLWSALKSKLDGCASFQATEELRCRFGSIGSNVQLSPNFQVDFPERIRIGNWVYIGPDGQFFGRGGLTIADHVIIGPRVVIMTTMHNFKNARYAPYDEIELLKSVSIGEASWVGYGSILMPGVILGKGCVVGAGSVVTKSFPDGSIIAGNPAKTIGMRDMEAFTCHLTNGRTYLKIKATKKLQKVERIIVVSKPQVASE